MAARLHDAPATERDAGERRPFPMLAVGATFGAALAFGGVAAVTRELGGNGIGMAAGAIVMLLAGVLLLIPGARGGALLLAWNGLGIGCAMFLIGIFSVGALIAFPLALIAIALASWPRAGGASIASGPAIVAQAGGFLLVPALYGMYGNLADDLRRLIGL